MSTDERGTPGHVPIRDYQPMADWLEEAQNGPMPRDDDGNPLTYDRTTGKWVQIEPTEEQLEE